VRESSIAAVGSDALPSECRKSRRKSWTTSRRRQHRATSSSAGIQVPTAEDCVASEASARQSRFSRSTSERCRPGAARDALRSVISNERQIRVYEGPTLRRKRRLGMLFESPYQDATVSQLEFITSSSEFGNGLSVRYIGGYCLRLVATDAVHASRVPRRRAAPGSRRPRRSRSAPQTTRTRRQIATIW
jgi:hypothetical protein